MDAVTGVFRSKETAEKALQDLRSNGIHADKITLLTPGEHIKEEAATIPAESTEQPGMGKAIGALIGGAAGLSGGLVLGRHSRRRDGQRYRFVGSGASYGCRCKCWSCRWRKS